MMVTIAPPLNARLYTALKLSTACAGGWGPASAADGTINIPTKDVMFVNNVVVNPPDMWAAWAHFAVSFCTRWHNCLHAKDVAV
jgi:hypothetical protein